METRDITLNSFVSAEEQAHVTANAPAEIEVDGIIFPVAYRHSRPLVRHFDSKDIARLSEEIYLEDGRQVYFIYGSKQYSPARLQSILGS